MVKNRPAIGATPRARHLRKNPTDAERALCRLLREYFPDARFRRQVPLLNYIADFTSHRARLVIEVDGGQHGIEADADRTGRIEAEGYRVIRFWNNAVLDNPEGVAARIAQILGQSASPDDHPHP